MLDNPFIFVTVIWFIVMCVAMILIWFRNTQEFGFLLMQGACFFYAAFWTIIIAFAVFAFFV